MIIVSGEKNVHFPVLNNSYLKVQCLVSLFKYIATYIRLITAYKCSIACLAGGFKGLGVYGEGNYSERNEKDA